MLNIPMDPTFHLRVFSSIVSLIIGLSTPCLAGTIENDPMGFYGIKWGHSLVNHPKLSQIDSEKEIAFYRTKNSNPTAWGTPVQSIKFLTLNDQFAQAQIHYRGEKSHQAILRYLEGSYGKNSRSPGSMMRGLNQQYWWRGAVTEISMSYHGLTERGFISIQSRILAAGLLNAVSDQTF